MTTPVVAVVGRPNVGKSTLVNRLVGRRQAIVEERPGVTRDRKELRAEWRGRELVIVDTGGWLPAGRGSGGNLAEQVSAQAERAVVTADVVVLVVDAAVGATEEDARVAGMLRRVDKPVLLVANKVDDDRREHQAWELNRLGLGDPIPVSALHGRGSGDLLDAIVTALPPAPDPEAASDESSDELLSVAIVGRPNVGKSTLFNRLVGDERSVVHDEPGTTRDSIDTIVETPGGPLRFVDTAGMRRRGKIDERTEYYSMLRALESVDRADAALLLVDATQGVAQQDQRLAERVDGAGTAVVVVLNKWDAADTEQRARVIDQVADRLGFLAYAPVLRISARTGRSVNRLLPTLREAEAAYHRRIPTPDLNRLLADAQAKHPAPPAGRFRPKVLYGTQGATDPPTFTLFATHRLAPTYIRYLERRIREAFALGPTPVKMRVRLRRD
ncbi:MAG: ribosome biogenesis GTPase Der [Acidimicrobiia bacterium]